MKKIGLVTLFLLLAGTTATSILFFTKADGLSDQERKLRSELNKAKTLLKEQSDQVGVLQAAKDRMLFIEANASTTLAATARDLNSTRTDLAALKSESAGLAASLAGLQTTKTALDKDWAAAKLAAETAKVELLKSQKDKTELAAATKKVHELQKEIDTVNGLMESQKLMLADRKAQVDEYLKLGLSPSQITKLQEDMRLLRAEATTPAATTNPAAGLVLPPPPLPPVTAPLAGRNLAPAKQPRTPLPK